MNSHRTLLIGAIVLLLGTGFLFAGPGDIVITEIMYEARVQEYMINLDPAKGGEWWETGDEPEADYVELHNVGNTKVELSGWEFVEGIFFTFPDVSIPAGGYLIVAADAAKITDYYGRDNVVGNFTGELEENNHRITLVDNSEPPVVIDTVRYRDDPPWPLAPDQDGRSLELMDPREDNSGPENWRSSRVSIGLAGTAIEPEVPVWQFVSATGTATSDRLYFYLQSQGEWLVDQIQLRPSGGGSNVLLNPSFENGDTSWVKTGNHAGTVHITSESHDGSGAERIVATGAGTSSSNSLQQGNIPVVTGQSYTLSCWLKRLSGSHTLTFRFSGGGLLTKVDAEGLTRPEVGDRQPILGGTPGDTNTVHRTDGLPPFVTEISHSPLLQTSSDSVLVTARVEGEAALADVTLHYEFYQRPFPYFGPAWTGAIPMEESAVSKLYEATIPATDESQTLVRYRIEATDVLGRGWTYPDEFALSPHRAYFSHDGEEDTELPLYFLIFSNTEFGKLEAAPFSKDTVDATIVVDGITYDHVKVRYRGCRQCPKKSHKVKFNRHEYLRDMRTLDFDHDGPVSQGVWSSLFWLVGQDNIASEAARLVRNGKFFGVFLTQESPNRSWLERHGRDPETEIYKSKSAGGRLNGAPGFNANLGYYSDLSVYPKMYIKRGDSLSSFEPLQEFTRDLQTFVTSSGAIQSYMENNLFLEDWLYRWTLHVTAPHCDFHMKNYYVMRTSEGIWDVIYFDYDRFWGCLWFEMGANDRPCHSTSTDPWCSGTVANSRIRNSRGLRHQFLQVLEDVVSNILTEESVIPLLDRSFDKSLIDREQERSGVTGVGSAVAPDDNLPEMRQYFVDRRSYLLGWLKGQSYPSLANEPPSITVLHPATFEPGFAKPVLIEWEYSDAEGDPVEVDLYWTDLAWSLLQPIASNISADDGQYVWESGVPMDNPRDIYIQAVARDGESTLVGRHTSVNPVSYFSEQASATFAPVLSPVGGSFKDEQEVTLTAQEGWAVYYTLDGSDPRASNTRALYEGSFNLTASAVVRAVAVRVSTGGGGAPPGLRVWDLADDWSDSSNPSDVWTYADLNFNRVSNHVPNWLGMGPAWAQDSSTAPALGKRQSSHPTLDLPEGRVFMHSPGSFVWTSPVSGEIEISGGIWLAADKGNKVTWVLSENADTIAAVANVEFADGGSSAPFLFSDSRNGAEVLTRTVIAGDTISFRAFATATDNEFCGVDFRITHQEEVAPEPELDLEYSPVSEATFIRPSDDYSGLEITEIMYNPPGGSLFEFLEVKNVGLTPIDLFGVQVTNGVVFSFRPNTVLEPGAFLVLVSNRNVFEAFYPEVEVYGEYLGSLSNGGEKVTIKEAPVPPAFVGETIVSVDYNDSRLWPIAPDGFGRSLVLVDAAGDPDNPESWRASADVGGSPGADDPPAFDGGVIINEVLSRGESPLEDAIELLNISGGPVDLSGWYLGDSRESSADLQKFQIPSDTVLGPGEFLVFYENQFNLGPADPKSFQLNSGGGAVYLSSANSSGELTDYIIERDFPSAQEGVSFGTYRSSVEMVFTALSARTFGEDDPVSVEEFRAGRGASNALPEIGPVVINEIFYHPPVPGQGDEALPEFIEIFNVTGSTIGLYDDVLDAGWRVDGISSAGGAGEYEFPPGTEIAAGGYVLVVPVDPLSFRSQHSIPGTVPIVGPFGGSIDNAGERIELFQPTLADGINVSFILVDEVRFNDVNPWPSAPDGGGPSLERVLSSDYGNEPLNWGPSVFVSGTPGSINTVSDPDFNFPPEADFAVEMADDLTALFDASGSSDRDGTIESYDWTFSDGGIASGSAVEHRFPGEGAYTVQLVVTDDGGAKTTFVREITIVLPFQRPGDANQDTTLDIVDAVSLLFLLFDPGGVSLPCEGTTVAEGGNATLLDFDGNIQITIGDPIGILEYLYSAGLAHALGTGCVGIAGCPDVCE